MARFREVLFLAAEPDFFLRDEVGARLVFLFAGKGGSSCESG